MRAVRDAEVTELGQPQMREREEEKQAAGHVDGVLLAESGRREVHAAVSLV